MKKRTFVKEEKLKIQKDPDTDYGYRKITFQLMILGFIVNHKKVYTQYPLPKHIG